MTDTTIALTQQSVYRELIGQRLRTEVRAGRACPTDVDQAAEVLARLAISLLLTRTITLDDDATIVALVRNVLLPMLAPRDG